MGFQRLPLKFHTKCPTHTLKDVDFIQLQIEEHLDLDVFEMDPGNHLSQAIA